MKISKLLIAAMAVLAVSCSSRELVEADYAVVPLPESITVEPQAQAFRFGPDTRIVASDSAQQVNARLFAGYVKTLVGFEPEIVTVAPGKDFIRFGADIVNGNSDAYVITVNADSIVVDGVTPAATFYGLQTLRKAIPGAGNFEVLYPAGTIADAPRFAYRGAHFDTARHFFAPDSVKMFIDMIALHNINRMHWHLTEDQGWRLEIKGRPELTEIGSKRAGTVIGHTQDSDSIPYGGYYTADEVRDIVKYAADRHITVIPEIDLPGHMLAALASYPELGCTGGPYEVWQRWGISDDVLCAGNDSVYAFLDDVMDQVVELFPSEYIHIGGDECPKVRWTECPKCQAKIKELGLRTDEHSTAEQKLQSHVMKHVADHLAAKGRKAIGWDEILEGGVDTSTVIMSWRGTEGGIAAAKAGHDAIMTPNQFMYFDFRQSDDPSEPRAATWGDPLTVEKVYSYEPIPDSFTPGEAAHIIGVQANLWTEHIPNYRQAEYMEMPRVAALAEVQWSKAPKDYDAFFERLKRLTKIYDAEDYNYRKTYFVQPDSLAVK